MNLTERFLEEGMGGFFQWLLYPNWCLFDNPYGELSHTSFLFPPKVFLKFSCYANLWDTAEIVTTVKKRDRLLMKHSKGTASPYSHCDEALGDAVDDCVVHSVISSTGSQ